MKPRKLQGSDLTDRFRHVSAFVYPLCRFSFSGLYDRVARALLCGLSETYDFNERSQRNVTILFCSGRSPPARAAKKLASGRVEKVM
jgi:hypothetical protein